MDKQRVAVIGPGSWGTALSQVLNDNGHEVRIWGNIAEQIDEINQAALVFPYSIILAGILSLETPSFFAILFKIRSLA